MLEAIERERFENYSDFTLLTYYNMIKRQHYKGISREPTLVKYINELEYRGLKYVRVMNYKYKRRTS